MNNKINENIIKIITGQSEFVQFQIRELKKNLKLVESTNKLISKDKSYQGNPIYANGVILMKNSESTLKAQIGQLEANLKASKDMVVNLKALMKEAGKQAKNPACEYC